jgi:DNA-binding Xre family transcriptional regulator
MMITVKVNHEKLAMALLTTNTVRDAAEQCGISESHIHRLKKGENFKKILRERREALFSLTNDRAIAYRERAFSILCEIAENKQETSCNRISAVKQIFAIGDFAKSEEIEERLQRLEELKKNEYEHAWRE